MIDVTTAIGWSLIHFTWQGSVLLLLLRAILMPCRSAVVRYNWALATLGLMALSPIVTFLVLRQSASALGPIDALIAAAVPGDTGVAPMRGIDWLVQFWLLGVVVLSVRALVGFCLTERLRRKGTIELAPEIRGRFDALRVRLAVRWQVRFRELVRVSVPVAIGWFRPVVLIPAGAIYRFSAAQLDALIVHELAHIKRLDPFVNLFQITVETLLFYNPAIWWVSRIIREEREACCDETAVAVCGDVVGYARVLTELETVRLFPVQAMAANGGVLKDRIARLLGNRPSTSDLSGLVPAIVGILCLAGCVFAQSPTDAAPALGEMPAMAAIDPPAPPPPPKIKAPLKQRRAPEETTGSYIGDLNAAGLKDLTVDDILAFKALGITPDYVRKMQATGIKNVTVHDYTGAKAVGVTPEFVESLQKQGIKNLSMDKIIGLRVTSGIDLSGLANLKIDLSGLKALRNLKVDVDDE